MIQKITISFILILFGISTATYAQQTKTDTLPPDESIVEFLILENGDTVLLGNDFSEVSISGNKYKSRKEEYHHYRVKLRAIKVYPFAVEAVRIFNEVDYYTKDMKNRNRKQHIKRLHKELKEQFEDPLKKLSRYEGYVLMCMVERELQKPLYDIVKELKGWFPATYWSNFAKVYGYDITKGYNPKTDPILENILRDLDVSYKMVKRR